MSANEATVTPPKAAIKDDSPTRSVFPVILSLGFVAAIVFAIFVERSNMPAPAAAGTPAPTPAAAPTPPLAPVSVDDLKSTKSEIEALVKKTDEATSGELKKLQEASDAMKTHADTTIAEFKKSIDGLKADIATAKEDAAKAKPDLKPLTDKIDALTTELASVKTELAKTKEAMAAKPATSLPTTEPAKPAVDAAAMTAAVDLFKGGKYADAEAAFKKLPATDARVLYYTAISVGFRTNFQGEAVELVTKGQQAEKAGTPPKAEIDTAFEGLTEAQGKKWLDYFRANIK